MTIRIGTGRADPTRLPRQLQAHHARLDDARFFWREDRKTALASRIDKLERVTFHEKLGSQKERVERIEQLAFELAGACDADPQEEIGRAHV